jgi:GT2 family glycosyltransferase
MALRRSTIERIGGLFDERSPVLGSDVELCRRIRDAGLGIYCLLDRAAVHHGSASLDQVPAATREDWWWQLIRLYYRLHEPRPSWT